MAIYYINPHTTTNGDGSFGSPWSFNSTTRTGFANGDEIRILGVAKTSLFTATSYTATITNQYSMTITAGGGLGADWAVGDIAYIEETDTFFRLQTKAGDVIGLNTASMLPILNTATTNYTLRRVNTETYGAGGTTATMTILPTSFNNVTVSDCWTDATTRVTDGSVKTIAFGSTTSVTVFNLIASAGSTVSDNALLNLQNTHIIAGAATTPFANVRLSTFSKNSVYDLNQMQGFAASIATSSFLCFDDVVTIKHVTGYLLTSTNTSKNTIFNINNNVVITINRFLTATTSGLIRALNCTINLENLIGHTVENSGGVLLTLMLSQSNTLNITGDIDCWSNINVAGLVCGTGPIKVAFGSAAKYYYNRRVSQQTSFTSLLKYSGFTPIVQTNSNYIYFTDAPTIPSGWSFTYTFDPSVSAMNVVSRTIYLKYQNELITISMPIESQGVAGFPQGQTGRTNYSLVYRNGTSPKEILSIDTGSDTALTQNEQPLATLDSSVYRTAGPSIKSYLQTRNSAIWLSNQIKAYKTIRIPVTASTSYTISGYIRTDDTSYVAGDCVVYVMDGDIELDSQVMTTSCINAWEQFSLTFTASQTEEVVFSMGVYYANGAKSYWLDDLTIS